VCLKINRGDAEALRTRVRWITYKGAEDCVFKINRGDAKDASEMDKVEGRGGEGFCALAKKGSIEGVNEPKLSYDIRL
jgi:hypothetical protein